MDIRWSPRKRIKLNPGVSSVNAKRDPHESTASTASLLARCPTESPDDVKRQSLKRLSTDFDKELDELLVMPDPGFNPTQVFDVDPEMELAMLRMDTEAAPPLQRELSRSLSRRDTAPLSELTNNGLASLPSSLDLKRHASEPQSKYVGFTQGTTQLVDDLEGIDIDELTAAIDGVRSDASQGTETKTMFSTRCTVEQVPVYSSDRASVGLQVREETTGLKRFISLQGVWLQAYLEDPWQIEPGDIVHVLSSGLKKWEDDHIVIGDSDVLFPDVIVLHPDVVISSTTLSASATCHRRSVIQNRVLAPDIRPPSSDPDDVARCLSPIIGNCVHEAVQAAASVMDFSENFILEAGEAAMKKEMLSTIWSVGSIPSAVLAQLRSRLSSISRWGRFEWPRTAQKLRGCEVEIRPKSLGVTGKLDMDIEDLTGARSCIEIKTGKPHAIHIGQVVLYYLLQYVDKFEKQEVDVEKILPATVSEEFLLLYLPNGADAESIKVKITAREAQNIMRNRNLIASHTRKRSLPPPIMKKGDCQFCPSRVECAALYPEEEKKFFEALQFVRRSNVAICSKEQIMEYQKRWLDWIDLQPTVEAIGGLSAVRRMRGNLLHMTANALLKSVKLSDAFFFNWLPALLGLVPCRVSDVQGVVSQEFNPKNRIGRVFAIDVDSEQDHTAKISKELILPIINRPKQRVLLCATSHQKVDLVLETLLREKPNTENVIRIASKAADVQECVRNKCFLPEDWMTKVGEIHESTSLFGCTVKAVHHDLLSRADFNLAIVIDAHKVPDPLLWGILLRSRQVVLIGDSSEPCDSPDDFLFRRLDPLETWTKPDQMDEQDSQVVVIED